MLTIPTFVTGLFDYADSFMLLPTVDVRQGEDVAIVKIRLLEERSPEDTRSSFWGPDRLGWKPQVQRISLSGLGRAQRNHVRVIAPADSIVRGARWSGEEDDLRHVRDGMDGDELVPLDRATLYKSGLDPESYSVEVQLEPSRGFFLVPAMLTTGLLAVLLTAAAYLQFADSRFSWAPPTFLSWQEWRGGPLKTTSIQAVQANFDAAVTVLAIVPPWLPSTSSERASIDSSRA